MNIKEYAVIIEGSGNNYSAYCPDVDGCIAAADTLEECKRLFQESLELHFEGMREDGLPIPEPTTYVGLVAIAA